MWKRLVFVSLLVSLLTGLNGCGFRLKGYDETYYNTLAFINTENSEVAQQLITTLKSQSLPKLVTDINKAELKVRWVSEEREKVAASFSAGGQTLSYEFILRIKLVLEDPLRPSQPATVQVSRLIQLDSSNPFAREEQEANAWRAIEADSVTQIMQRLRRPIPLETTISDDMLQVPASLAPPCPSAEPCQASPSTPQR